ncbi:hypothetical protein D3C86_1692010 [compost metagenome]
MSTSGHNGFDAVINATTKSNSTVEHSAHYKRSVRMIVYKTNHHLIANFWNCYVTSILCDLICSASIWTHHSNEVRRVV